MANNRLIFFDKVGDPLNFEYIGPTGPSPLDSALIFIVNPDSSIGGNADLSILDSQKKITINLKDINGFDGSLWALEIAEYIKSGADVKIDISVLASSNRIIGNIKNVDLISKPGEVIITFKSYTGNTFIGNGKKLYIETSYINRPGGYFKGFVDFKEVSAGLFENYQIYILQEFREQPGGPLIFGHPHADLANPGKNKWRTRWENNKYGNTDVSNIIFTYKIIENDPETGEPAIYNYPNIVYEILDNSGDSLDEGYVVTSNNIESHISIDVAMNTIEIGADVYERKLIVEELTDDGPKKVLELNFYGEVIGEDERLDILTKNLGRAFIPQDSTILRDHDPHEPFPDYIEINDKRKELLVAGEEIFPYIGSYKGLINAMRFFGYQDLRIKEYWLNIKYEENLKTPLQTTTGFLEKIRNPDGKYTQNVLIKDVLDNENSGKYKLTQTYGPDKDGNYVLDVSSGSTIVPSNTYKKTSLFGLYYDIHRPTGKIGPHGYPISEDVFMFSQEEVILKLFALKNRLKESYLPLNARIVDITGEGVYYNIYNTRVWSDTVNRLDVNSGFTPKISVNPDFGFIEDLTAFNIKPNVKSIQIPNNYNNVINLTFNDAGYGDAFKVDGYLGYNPTIFFERGKKYIIKNNSAKYPLFITRDSSLNSSDPYGIINNGAILGNEITLDVHPEENLQLYYYSGIENPKMNGKITTTTPSISDLGNISNPLSNGQKYNADEARAIIDSIENFYRKKQDREIKDLGDIRYDPSSFIDPKTGKVLPPPIGMPVIFTLNLDEVKWDDLDVTWNSLQIPILKKGEIVTVQGDDSLGDFSYMDEIGKIIDVDYTTGIYEVLLNSSIIRFFGESSLFSSKQRFSLLNWDNIDFSNYLEIEWIITKDTEQEGIPYEFSFKGPIMEFYKYPHFLPYVGTYTLTCKVHDSYNFKSTRIVKNIIEVSPKTVNIDAWTRYHENEEYLWDNMVRPWKDYKSIWEYPGEGDTYEEGRETLSYDALNFINYGNSAYEGQNLLVKTINPGKPSSAEFIFSQDEIEIVSIISKRVGSTSQYSIAEIITATPHNFVNGSIIHIANSIADINGDWQIDIPAGSDQFTFTIPIVLEQQLGVEFNISQLSIDPILHPNQFVTGGGTIEISIDSREIAKINIDSEIEATTSLLIAEINKTYTIPDYIASTDIENPESGKITISSKDKLLNGIKFEVITTGSAKIVSSDGQLSGGIKPFEEYIEWEETDKYLPNENLKWWGTKRFSWEEINKDLTWDDFYAHSWDDFEYNNDWLGGFSIYGAKEGDHIKVSPSTEILPFPIGVTLTGTNLTLGDVTKQLNESLDMNITNFDYRVYPSALYKDNLTNSGPVEYTFSNVTGITSGYPAPITVPGANPVNSPDFTYII